MIECFHPIIDKKSKIIILGTVPSVMSLQKRQYYGNERNQFWNIIYALFNRPLDSHYEKRKQFLLDHHIAVWDVLESCEREGSMDSKIKSPVPNDIKGLLDQYPNIGYICFNGAKAEELFNKLAKEYVVDRNLKFLKLPSSSPARAMALEDKASQWRVILEVLSVAHY